jgi:hypothetical protein
MHIACRFFPHSSCVKPSFSLRTLHFPHVLHQMTDRTLYHHPSSSASIGFSSAKCTSGIKKTSFTVACSNAILSYVIQFQQSLPSFPSSLRLPPLNECQKFQRFSRSGCLAIYHDSPPYIDHLLNKTLPQPVHVDGRHLSVSQPSYASPTAARAARRPSTQATRR